MRKSKKPSRIELLEKRVAELESFAQKTQTWANNISVTINTLVIWTRQPFLLLQRFL